MNICGENRHLRQARKRYRSVQKANRTNGTFGFSRHTSQRLKNQKSHFFPTLDKKLLRNKRHLKNYCIFVKK
jgi:hypothetical protein